MHNNPHDVRRAIARFSEELSAMQVGAAPSSADIASLRASMLNLARSAPWDSLGHRPAQGDEELLYPLFEAAGRPSLYLVSDGPGVRSAPHEHCTWAVIVGLAGNELNEFHEADHAAPGSVRPVSETALRAFDALYLPPGAIHATLAADGQPTYHLHLYGKPLRELPPYPSRCFALRA
jgi:predicted metal-dependent enzyme (double-stranded beta helix superfamily)